MALSATSSETRRAGRRRRLAIASGLVAAVLVVGAAVSSQGYVAQRLDLSDPSLWVRNGEEGLLGRANVELNELDTLVEAPAASVRLVQYSGSVWVHDVGSGTLAALDQATATVGEAVTLPSGVDTITGTRAGLVLHAPDTGGVWIVPAGAIAGVESDAPPTIELGADSTIAVGDGELVGYSRVTGLVSVVSLDAPGTAEQIPLRLGDAEDDFAVTFAGDDWFVLDVTTRQLASATGTVELAGFLAADGDPRLQLPSEDDSRVLIADRSGLLSVPLEQQQAPTVLQRAIGVATAPATVGDCVYTAWADGSAWRDCGGATTSLQLEQPDLLGSAPDLVLRYDRGRVLLNDSAGGASWNLVGDGELINNWRELADPQPEKADDPQPTDDDDPKLRRRQQPPIAKDDEFGARPGRPTVLPVLLNDRDPNGDALIVDRVEPDSVAGTVSIVAGGAALLLRFDDQAAGRYTFEYRIDDGRSGGRDTAKVRVEVAGDESAPEQRGETSLSTGPGGTVAGDVLGDWVDPEGDPVYVVGATASGDDQVTTTPEGRVTFTSGGEVGDRIVRVTVSDGFHPATGTMAVEVAQRGQQISLDPFTVQATVNEPVTVRPLDYAQGGRDRLRLQAVSDTRGVIAVADYERGTVQLTAAAAGSEYIEYSVSDGGATRTGVFRLEVTEPAGPGLAPVPVPDSAFVDDRTFSTTTIAPLANDVDPAGGVLVLTGLRVSDDAQSDLVRVELLESRFARITALAPFTGGPVELTYTVSNGAASAEGTVSVIGVGDDQSRAPIVVDDTATVRVGGDVSIPVLRNDTSPDGSPLHLDPQLPDTSQDESGYAFASSGRLRFLAPDTPGTVAVRYNAMTDRGATSTGVATISVIAADPATNRGPIPDTLSARVFSDSTVRVRIPLAGIDPDGDGVTLLAQQIVPGKGTIRDTGPDWIEYEPRPLETGTDRFPYTVVDDFGAQATGFIEIGIAGSPDGTEAPVAAPDAVEVRPSGTVVVDVLSNDSDPQGSKLTLAPDSLLPNDGAVTARVVDGRVRIDVPDREGDYAVAYRVENEHGLAARSSVSVRVDAEAPLHRPELRDVDLGLADVIGRESVDVDVLDGAFFADGDVRDLQLALVPGWAAGVTLQNGVLTAPVGERTRLVPFTATNPDDATLSTTALVRIPGLAEALPQLDRTAPPIRVTTGERVVIELNEHIISTTGTGVRLTDPDAVSATNADGAPLVVDDDTVQYASDPEYFGPASITVEVTDTDRETDAAARIATVVIPITVVARENLPPVFRGAQGVALEPGETLPLDLRELTAYDGDDADLYYELGSLPGGTVDASLSGDGGGTLTLHAASDARIGTIVRIPVGVRDQFTATWDRGVIEVAVVASSRPLAIAVEDAAVVQRGQTTVLDVLANDLSNPFPDTPLRVRQITGLDDGRLPPGVRVRPSDDRSEIQVEVARTADARDIALQYQVVDATNDLSRSVWGVVRISIRDAPDAPVAPERDVSLGFESGRLTLLLTPPESNNSPITGYRIIAEDGYRHECGNATVCTLSDLVPGRRYTFRAIAINAVGPSDAGPASEPLSADTLPNATGRVTVASTTPASAAPDGRSLDVSWNAVPDPRGGSPVKDYLITVDGLGSITRPATTTKVTINDRVFPQIENAVNYTVTVIARNSAQVLSTADWNRASGHGTTIGPPSQVRSPAPTASVNLDDGDGSIRVNWGSASPNGAAGVTYSVARYDGRHDAEPCTPSVKRALISPPSVQSGWLDTTAVDGQTYTYVVYADNGIYCSATPAEPTTSKAAPGTTSMRVALEPRPGDPGSGYYDIRVSDLTVSTGTAEYFEYRLTSASGVGGWERVPDSGWVTGAGVAGVSYGSPATVEIRGCRDVSGARLCGQLSAASDPFVPTATRATVVRCTVGDPPEIAPPANAGTPAVGYAVAYRGLGEFGGFDRTGDDDVPPLSTGIRVRTTVTIDGQTLTDPGFAEAPCEAQ